MAGESQEAGRKAEASVAQAIGDKKKRLHEMLGEMLGAEIDSCKVVEDKRIKPDLLLESRGNPNGFPLKTWATLKSSTSENGTSGHAGRFCVADAMGIQGMEKAVVDDCLDLVSSQEYEYASRASRARAKELAEILPSREIARLGIVGNLTPAPSIMVVCVGGQNPTAFFGPVGSLFLAMPERGAVLVEPKSNCFYPSIQLSGGVFGVKRSGGTAGEALQITVSSAQILQLFKSGGLPLWKSCKVDAERTKIFGA